MSFDEAYKKTALFEGGYVNDPVDRGGETFRGISRKNHPGWSGWILVDMAVRAARAAGHPARSKAEAAHVNNWFKNHRSMDQLVKNFYKANFWDVFETPGGSK